MAPSATSKAEAVTTTTTQPQTTATTAATADDGPAVDQLPPSLASFKTAYESGDVEMVKGIFTDDKIKTTTERGRACRPRQTLGWMTRSGKLAEELQ
ncbi:MAG: hypothetical protein WBN93_06535 [Acidimicrobiia bacterium]